MRKVENICFPRSGHRLFQRLLKAYFGDELKNGTIYGPNKKFFQTHNVNYLKNHDLRLDTMPNKSIRYLIQIRHPIESLVSWYRLEHKNIMAQGTWNKFSKTKSEFWVKFCNKWIIKDMKAERLIVDYADVISKPRTVLIDAIEFMSDDGSVDMDRVDDVLASHVVKRQNSIKDFEYYDLAKFDRLMRYFHSKVKFSVRKNNRIEFHKNRK